MRHFFECKKTTSDVSRPTPPTFLGKLGLSCTSKTGTQRVPGDTLPPSGGPTSVIDDAGFSSHFFFIKKKKQHKKDNKHKSKKLAKLRLNNKT
jgi:hypothetical protein